MVSLGRKSGLTCRQQLIVSIGYTQYTGSQHSVSSKSEYRNVNMDIVHDVQGVSTIHRI